MRKAPRTGPGPLCSAAVGLGKFGASRGKASPRSPGSKCCLPGGQVRPQLALAVSMELAPGIFLCLAQGFPAERDGRAWGRCGQGHKGFSQELGLLWSWKKAAPTSWKGGNRRRRRFTVFSLPPYTSQELSRMIAGPGLFQSQKIQGPPEPAGSTSGAGRTPGAVSGCQLAARTKDQSSSKEH